MRLAAPCLAVCEPVRNKEKRRTTRQHVSLWVFDMRPEAVDLDARPYRVQLMPSRAFRVITGPCSMKTSSCVPVSGSTWSKVNCVDELSPDTSTSGRKSSSCRLSTCITTDEKSVL